MTQQHLDEIALRGGPIPAEEVDVLCRELGTDVDGLMIRLLPVASSFARVPISGFRVGAVARATGGDGGGALYLGANVEFTGQALGFSVHAEQAAVVNAWEHGEVGLEAIATSAAPCGHCRQFLQELEHAGELTVLEPSADDAGGGDNAGGGDDGDRPADPGAPRRHPLAELLPQAFTAADLGLEGGLMNPAFDEPLLSLDDPDPLVETEAGLVFTGRLAESAAYNPTISPLESAIAYMVMNSPAGAEKNIVRAVLVECPSRAGQRGATEAVLSAVAPGVKLEYHHTT